MTKMEIMEAINIAIIKSRLGIRATIPEKDMRPIMSLALMERTKSLVMVFFMTMEHMKSFTSHSRNEGDVRYNAFSYAPYKNHSENMHEDFEDSYALPYGTSYQS